MNVMFKVDDKFVLALNYSSGLDRLSETLTVMGPGYDIYLCLKPRPVGEGDLVIDELSMTGLPFNVDVEELYTVLKFFLNSYGVSDVYLCNWVHNYIATARITTFKSVFYYGDRVGYLVVKDKMVNDFRVFPSQLEFLSEIGADYDGYGDIGLIDVEGVTAHYPELRGVGKQQLVMLSPIVHCYRTALKMPTQELMEDLRAILAGETNTRRKRIVYASDEPTPIKKIAPLPEEPRRRRKWNFNFGIRGRVGLPALGVLGLVLAMTISAFLGYTFMYTKSHTIPTVPDGYYSSIEERITGLDGVKRVYDRGAETSTLISDMLNFVQSSGLDITIVGFEGYLDRYVVRCSCSSADTLSSFIDYIHASHVVISTNDLGVSVVSGVSVQQYSIMFSI